MATKVDSSTDEIKHRRRGTELEDALLTAAWLELKEVGFAKLTMESVAERARTGVAVLYRRWSNKSEIVREAIRHYGVTHPVTVPDTGSLREDMIQLLANVSAGRLELAAIVGATFAGLNEATGLVPEQVRVGIRGSNPFRSYEVFQRANERGEIDLASISEDVLSLPFELLRHDILMTMHAIPRRRILSIVDDIFLPLVLPAKPSTI
jgi:AcrR family transcriptional regulator